MLELSARSNDWAAGPWWVSVPDEVDAVASAVPPASRVNAAAVRTSLADRPKLRCDDALGAVSNMVNLLGRDYVKATSIRWATQCRGTGYSRRLQPDIPSRPDLSRT